jgi:endoglucanase
MKHPLLPPNPTRRALMSGAASSAALLAAGCSAAQQASATIESAPFTPPSGPSPVERHGRLRAEGARIVDEHGAPVMLRGMSLFWSQWMGQYYTADAVRWLRQDWGVNVVRAAIAPFPGGWVDNPEREMAKADAVIQASIDLGIYVIVDWHAHAPAPEQAAQFFTEIASRYGAHPHIIYETYNEPLDTHDWANVVKPFHQRVNAAIRAHDESNLIVAGSTSWSQDVDIAAADPLDDPNLAYTLHFYAGSHGRTLREKALRAMDLGKALFVTEYGTVNYDGDGPIDHASTQRWWDFMEEHHISHLCWSIADKEESSAALLPGASGNGGWPDDMLSPSGLLLRNRIRAMNAGEYCAPCISRGAEPERERRGDVPCKR